MGWLKCSSSLSLNKCCVCFSWAAAAPTAAVDASAHWHTAHPHAQGGDGEETVGGGRGHQDLLTTKSLCQDRRLNETAVMVGKRKFGTEACCQCQWLARAVTVAEAKAVGDFWWHSQNVSQDPVNAEMNAAISNVCAVYWVVRQTWLFC